MPPQPPIPILPPHPPHRSIHQSDIHPSPSTTHNQGTYPNHQPNQTQLIRIKMNPSHPPRIIIIPIVAGQDHDGSKGPAGNIKPEDSVYAKATCPKCGFELEPGSWCRHCMMWGKLVRQVGYMFELSWGRRYSGWRWRWFRLTWLNNLDSADCIREMKWNEVEALYDVKLNKWDWWCDWWC